MKERFLGQKHSDCWDRMSGEFYKLLCNNQRIAHYCAILNQETVSGSQFYAEYIYNAFALLATDDSLHFIQKNITFVLRSL